MRTASARISFFNGGRPGPRIALPSYFLAISSRCQRKVDLAGFSGKEVEINLLYNVLTITAKRKSTEKVLSDAEPEIKMIYAHRPETLVARITLPFIPPKDDDDAKQPSIADKSTISNGVLTVKIINIPKLDIQNPTG